MRVRVEKRSFLGWNKSSVTLTVSGAVLSRCVTTSSVMGSWTCPEKLSPPLMCATNPSSSQVAL